MMRRFCLLVSLVAGFLASLSSPTTAAYDDLPRTFVGCVAEGGDVRRAQGEITCRLVRSYDFRVYGTGETACGEVVDIEIWGETRTGVVTYLLAPGRTVDLPELGEEDMVIPEDPIACLDD